MTDRRVIMAPVTGASHATRARSTLWISPPNPIVRRHRPVGTISHSPPAIAQTTQHP